MAERSRLEIRTEVVTTRMSGSQPRRLPGLLLLHLAKGRTRWQIDGSEFDVMEGDLVWILPGQLFNGIESSEGIPIRVEMIEALSGSRSDTMVILERLGVPAADAPLLEQALVLPERQKVHGGEPLKSLFGDLVRRGHGRSSLEVLHHRAGLLRFLTGLACGNLSGEVEPDGFLSGSERRVERFLEELEARCEDEWSLELMAITAGLKRSRFGLICRRLTGESPMVFLNRLRIRKGRRMLRETELPVTRVAFDCGFSSSQYFAKMFRRFQGMEPSHYRKIMKEGVSGQGVHYLKGDSAWSQAMADREIGKGDFSVSGEIALDRLGGTAASLEFGEDRFGFDGRSGCFFLEGGYFGDARFFMKSFELIHEGTPFPFELRRKGRRLIMKVSSKKVFEVKDDPTRWIGVVGLRPLRNGIRVLRFRINGDPVPLVQRDL